MDAKEFAQLNGFDADVVTAVYGESFDLSEAFQDALWFNTMDESGKFTDEAHRINYAEFINEKYMHQLVQAFISEGGKATLEHDGVEYADGKVHFPLSYAIFEGQTAIALRDLKYSTDLGFYNTNPIAIVRHGFELN